VYKNKADEDERDELSCNISITLFGFVYHQYTQYIMFLMLFRIIVGTL